jgi:hypothetical protein
MGAARSTQWTMTIIVSETASKKIVSGWRSRADRRVVAKPKTMAKTTMPRMASSAAARIGLAGARLVRKAEKPPPPRFWRTSSSPTAPAISSRPPSGSIGQIACRPIEARMP